MMGMYTEVMFRAEVDKSTYQVFELLKAETIPKGNPHPFFTKPRALAVLHGRSYYFPGAEHLVLEHDTIADVYSVSLRSSLKNYDGEVEAFFDWVTPHVLSGGGAREFIGYSLYEENDAPSLYFASGDEA